MVRFRWQVDPATTAEVPPGSQMSQRGAGVQHMHVTISTQAPAASTEACLTVLPAYLQDNAVKATGIVLGHGQGSGAAWQGCLLTELSIALAKEGYLVMRPHCDGKEPRQQLAFEAAMDAGATSPFGRGIKQWVSDWRRLDPYCC